MPKIEHKPIPTDNQVEALAALEAYKKQNPVKYEQKKAALFAKYGLEDPELKAQKEEEARIAAKVAEELAKKEAEAEAEAAKKAEEAARKAAEEAKKLEDANKQTNAQ